MCETYHSHLTLNQRRRVDPTATIVLRRRYIADLNRRFKRLEKLIREALIEDDALGLSPSDFQTQARRPGKRAFAFTRSDDKVSAFMAWLKRASNNEVLGIVEGTPLNRAAQSSWQNVYIESAYQKGLSRAASKIKATGASVQDSWIQGAMYRPIHADRIGLVYTRAFSDLEGITRAMDTAISRALAQGLAEGRNSRDIAKTLTEKVKSIGRTRAARLARTEVIAAHAEASLNGYEEAGAEGVEAEVEFTTAGDNKVCPKCRELEGQTYTLKQARGIIPVHPNCRCAWNPIITIPQGLRLT